MRANIIRSYKYFIGKILFKLDLESYANKVDPYLKAERIVQFFYYYLAFESVASLKSLDVGFSGSQNFSPVWLISWISPTNLDAATNFIKFGFLISALVAAFYYKKRLARILVFLAVFHLHALFSSFLRFDHHWYLWLYLTFILIFLPDSSDKNPSTQIKKRFLLVLLSAQSVLMLIYTMAGLEKINGAFQQWLAGDVHAFASEAFSLQIANWLSSNNTNSLLGAFMIDNRWLGWPLFVSSIYLQLFAFFIVFRPSLQRFWALGLILLHVGTYLTMNILYISSSLFLMLFFFDSPFIKEQDRSFRSMLKDLPVFGTVLKLIMTPK